MTASHAAQFMEQVRQVAWAREPILRQSASMVLSSALRNMRLSFENTCSIGLRSGEYLGKKMRRAPLRGWPLDGGAFVRAEIVHDDDISGESAGAKSARHKRESFRR